MASRKALSDQLREAIDSSGMSRYALCKLIQVKKEDGRTLRNLAESELSRFMSGERPLSQEAVDRIGELLKLRIVSDHKPKKGG